MDVLAYDGFWFDEITGMTGGIETSTSNRWSISVSTVNRGAAPMVLGTGAPTPRYIDVTFVLTEAPANDPDFWDVFDKLIGRLNPDDQSNRRKLIAQRPDGTQVYRYARVTEPSGWDVDGSINTAVIRFISADPRWYKTTARTVNVFADTRLGTDTSGIIPGPNNPAIALPNQGFATAQPIVTVFTGGVYSGSGGWRYRRRLTIENEGDYTVDNFVALVELGDTADLVTNSKALSSGNDLRVIGPDGNEVPRDLVAWNHTGSWMYVYVASIPPGESVNYWVVYGNASAGSPLTLTYPYIPAFRMDGGYGGSVTAASTTTSIVLQGPGSGVSAVTNTWVDAIIVFTTGANAGSSRRITASTYNGGLSQMTLTLSSALSNTPATTDDWVIITSRNGVWLYKTQNDYERGTDTARGRWYINSGEGYPSIVDYEVPGSWRPDLWYDGRDRHGNPGYTRITNSGDADPYAILNVHRTYENGNVVIPEDGAADGMSISLPFPITGYDWSGTLENPNGMAKGVVACRPPGGNTWQTLEEKDTVSASSSWTPNLSIASGTQAIYHGLIPYEGEEISQKWRRDSGTSSATGSTTTIVDSTKAWRTNQWAGYFARITNGARAGRMYAISSNTATTLTVATMPASSPENLSYEIVGSDIFARLYDGSRCTLTWDNADFDVSALGTEEFCTDLSVRFWMGGGKGSSTVLSGHRRGSLEIGKDPESFVLVKDSSTYNVRADSTTRQAIQYDALVTAGGSVVERYTPPRVEWLATDETGLERASADGMPIPPNLDLVVSNPAAATGITNWTSSNQPEVGYSFTRSTSRYAGNDHDGNAYATSFQITITTNSGGPTYATAVCDDRFPIEPGELAQFAAMVRTSAAGIKPLLGIRFYDALTGGSTVSTELQSDATYVTNLWLTEGFAAEAPAGALAWSPLIRANIPSGTTTGNINFTAVDPAAPTLFFQTDHDIGPFRVEYVEAYLQ